MLESGYTETPFQGGLKMINRLMVFTLLLFTGGLLSCTSVDVTARKEPNIIVVRNMSHDDLKTAYLSAVAKDEKSAVRFGSVSPVPRGISQSVVRARTAPPLPPALLLRLTDKFGHDTVTRVFIKDLVASATGADNEALVFVIKPDNSVEVSLEYQ